MKSLVVRASGRIALGALAAAVAGGCALAAPPSRGEVLLLIDTDLAVPELASRLRVDVYAPTGEWFESRDVFLGNPSDWPASFGLLSPDDRGVSHALVRLRVFPEGATRTYRGERNAPPPSWEPTRPATSYDELCADPPLLAIGSEITLRRGREAILPETALNGSAECQQGFANSVGSVALRLVIPTAGVYHFAVTDTSPTLPASPDSLLPQVTLELRTDCHDDASGIACTYGMYVSEDLSGQPYRARIDAELEPGTYYLVTGGVLEGNGVTDVTLAAWSDDVGFRSKVGTAPPIDEPLEPWLAGDPTRTPSEEPDPARAVDRVIAVSIEPNQRSTASVILRGDCVGRPARLADLPGAVVAEQVRACADDPLAFEAPRAPEPRVDAVFGGAPSRQGTFAAGETCSAADSDDRIVCVPSGAFVEGALDVVDEAGLDAPPRTVALHRFWIDRYELTVADFRADLAAGLSLADVDVPWDNEDDPHAPNELDEAKQLCTWSAQPMDREALPLTCIPWYGARAWCQFRGGDLPKSAQWEYAALRAGHAKKSLFPWGDTAPSCACDGSDPACHASVFERDPLGRSACIDLGFGPAAPSAQGGPNGDVSPLGIVGLAGNVREWTLDSALPLDHPCQSGTWDPVCDEPYATARIQRGPSFIQWAVPSASTFFWQPAQQVYDAGVRCVHPHGP